MPFSILAKDYTKKELVQLVFVLAGKRHTPHRILHSVGARHGRADLLHVQSAGNVDDFLFASVGSAALV
jgi:hypothetical protein